MLTFTILYNYSRVNRNARLMGHRLSAIGGFLYLQGIAEHRRADSGEC